MTICRVEQCSSRTDLDAVAALRTIEPAKICADHGVRTTPTRFDRLFAHPFIANTRATLAENAALRIVCNHRREIFLGVIVFLFREAFFESTPVERHFLEFALTTAIANR